MNHPLLQSREQDLAASPVHQRLMANLSPGPLLKSQQHADALAHHLRAGGNTHASDPGENVAIQIRRSHGPDPLLRGVPKRKSSNGVTDEDRELSRLSDAREQRAAGSMSKSFGSFNRLKERVRIRLQCRPVDLAKCLQSEDGSAIVDVLNELFGTKIAARTTPALVKSTTTDNGDFDSFESRYGFAAHAPVVKAITATAKPLTKSVVKPVTMATIKTRLLGLAKAVGNTDLVKALEAGTNSDSATLTGGSAIRKQSLSKRVASTTIGGDPKPRYSPEELLKGAAAALHAGAITGAEAQAIQHHVNMTGNCPDHLLKKLTGETAATPTRLLTRSEVEAACAKGMQSGAISGTEGIHVNTCLSLGHPIDGGVMQRLKSIHHSK